MGVKEEPYIYWSVLVPVSIVGIVCNLLLIWIWCAERYKFNRLIIMTLDAFYCVFLSSYHLWRNVRGISDNYKYYSSFAVFTVRSYTVLLNIFLSGMQYLWSRDLKICRFNRPIFSKRRIITGLILCLLYTSDAADDC